MSFKLIERRVHLFVISILAFLIGTVIYYKYTWDVVGNLLSTDLNARLEAAAGMVPQVLARDFHDRAVSGNSISREEELRNREHINNLVRTFGLHYAQSVAKEGEKFFFTAPTVTETESTQRRSWYFYPYNDIPELFKEVYETGHAAYTTYTDEWGMHYALCKRFMSPGGKPYLVIVDFDADKRTMILAQGWKLPLLSVLWLLFIASPGVYLLFLMNRDISEANKSLSEANTSLEEQIARQSSELERGDRKSVV